MISTIILLGVWRYVFNLGAERGLTNAEPENSGWWPLSFVIAAGLLSSINSLELVTLNSARVGRLLVFGQAAAATAYLIGELTRKDKKMRVKRYHCLRLLCPLNRCMLYYGFLDVNFEKGHGHYSHLLNHDSIRCCQCQMSLSVLPSVRNFSENKNE